MTTLEWAKAKRKEVNHKIKAAEHPLERAKLRVCYKHWCKVIDALEKVGESDD